MRTWVWSLTSLSGLRIWHCCELWWRSQTQLRSGVGVPVADSTPSLGTPICMGKALKKKVCSDILIQPLSVSLCLHLVCLFIIFFLFLLKPEQFEKLFKVKFISMWKPPLIPLGCDFLLKKCQHECAFAFDRITSLPCSTDTSMHDLASFYRICSFFLKGTGSTFNLWVQLN